ncbi:MAG TPA: hypothetical protein VG649_13485 [Candidatus Angelobacter sp.]|nr:hypothetical protein [Candidatus Angelobacter sp.]
MRNFVVSMQRIVWRQTCFAPTFGLGVLEGNAELIQAMTGKLQFFEQRAPDPGSIPACPS